MIGVATSGKVARFKGLVSQTQVPVGGGQLGTGAAAICTAAVPSVAFWNHDFGGRRRVLWRALIRYQYLKFPQMNSP